MENIGFEDFKKADLRVVRVFEANRLEGSDKLIKIDFKLDEEDRQIVAGIGKYYEPEDLKNKQIVIIANLEPRSLMGVESQGMLLAAHDENDNPVFLIPEKESKDGSPIG